MICLPLPCYFLDFIFHCSSFSFSISTPIESFHYFCHNGRIKKCRTFCTSYFFSYNALLWMWLTFLFPSHLYSDFMFSGRPPLAVQSKIAMFSLLSTFHIPLSCTCHNITSFTFTYLCLSLSPPARMKLRKGKDFCPFCSLIDPKQLGQDLTYSRTPVSMYGVKEVNKKN